MAKKPGPDNFDALGSVFDFLFTEAKKPPEKRKPVKLSNFAADSALTDAMFSALERPGAFVSDSLIAEFNRAITLEMGRVSYGSENVKFTSTNFIDFLKDPGKQFQKLADTSRAIRSAQRVTYMGAAIDDLITTAWAHKYGDLEARSAIYANIENKQKGFEARAALGQYGGMRAKEESKIQQNYIPGRTPDHYSNFLSNRSFDLLGKKIFGEAGWESLPEDERNEISKQFGGNKKSSEIRTYLDIKYGSAVVTNFDSAITLGGFKADDNIEIYGNSVLYRKLENDNLTRRIATTTNSEEREIYRKTQYLLNRDRKGLNDTISSLQTALKSTTLTSIQRKEYREQLRNAKGTLRLINGHTLFGTIGKAEGYLGSLKNTYGGVLGTNLFGNVINGTFFNPDINGLFRPTSRKEVVENLQIYVPRENKLKLMQKYNEIGTNIYYLTPGSLLKTVFYNGEGFAFMLNKKLEKLQQLPGFSLLNMSSEDLRKGFAEQDPTAFIEGTLNSARAVLTPEQLAKLEGYLKTAKGWRSVANVSGWPYQMQFRINKFFKDKLIKFRTKIKDGILRNPTLLKWFAKHGADKLLIKWAAKGGLDVLVRSVITAVMTGLGFAITGPMAFVITALTWVATDFALKIVAFGINIMKWAALGIFAIFLFFITIGSSNVIKFNKETLSYRSEVPGDIIMCSAYEEVELEEGEEPWGDVTIRPPSNASCPLGEGSFYCSQGYKDVEGWSHQRIPHLMPVDITNVYDIFAPQFCSTNECTISYVGKISCSDGSDAGGIVELTANDGSTTYTFKFLHVQPIYGTGTKVSGGVHIASVLYNLKTGNCWTGPHLHLETKQNGSVVDPLELLQSFGCSVPDESACANP